MHSGSSLTPNNPAFSVTIGIAALVLEGRPLFDDEYAVSDENIGHHQRRHDLSSSTASISTPTSSKPSNRHHQYNSNRWPESYNSDQQQLTTPASRQDSVQHLQRLRQKLHQLRSTPSTSRDCVEQLLTVESGSPNNNAWDSDDELEEVFKQSTSSASSSSSIAPLSKSTDKKSPTIALNSLQVLAATSIHTTPRSFYEHNGLLKTVESFFVDKLHNTPSTSGASSSGSSSTSTPSSSGCTPVRHSIEIAKLKAKAKLASFGADKAQHKILGPHCELFLKKIGLMKGNGAVSDQCHDFDEHFCDNSFESCFRWQLHYRQLVSVFTRSKPICIEVYLGPENHAILLEQWIVQQTNGSERIPMTLQSLCTAIRSQLYFSQVTAWSDLLKSSSPHDAEINNNPRIKNGVKIGYTPKLDILYRIRPYDTTSCFTATPVEHKFPETMVTENLSVRVSLKSLPRMKSIPQLYISKIPIDIVVDVDDVDDVDVDSVQPMLLDDRLATFQCNEKGKHRCPFDEESVHDGMEAVVPAILLSHRDKQLNKYMKRLQRRDKKKRGDETTSATIKLANNTGSSSSSSPSPSSSSTGSAQSKAIINIPTSTITSTATPTVEPLLIANQTNSQYNHTINSIRPPLYSSLSTDVPATANDANDSTNTITATITKCTQTTAIVMATVATQTDNNVMNFPNCDFCGVEMQYFCWNCDKKMFADSNEAKRILGKADLLLQAIKRTPMTKQVAQCNTTDNTVENVDDVDVDLDVDVAVDVLNTNPFYGTCDKVDSKGLELSDLCCKRQKIVHNFFVDNDICSTANNNNNNNNNNNDNINSSKGSGSDGSTNNNNSNHSKNVSYVNINSNRSYDDRMHAMKNEMALGGEKFGNVGSGGYRRTLSESIVGSCISGDAINNAFELDLAASQLTMNVITNEELKLFRRAYSEDELICNCDDNRPKQDDPDHNACDRMYPSVRTAAIALTKEDLPLSIREKLVINEQQFHTPTITSGQLISSPIKYKTNPLYISCRDDGHSMDTFSPSNNNNHISLSTSKLTTTKPIPKVNLTKLFNSPQSSFEPFAGSSTGTFNANLNNNDLDVDAELEHMSNISMPISLSSVFNFDNLSPPLPSPTSGILVQKSNSAPTFAHMPALSPRFIKSAAAYKRRSRHLSDRSSIGSDEHFSDEEFHQLACDNENEYRPGISPTKAALKLFPKNYGIRRRALLGSFEESLLQRRFEPKFLVPGYKVLLGASGCYCTTQITIPAYTFFYELNAETMSTPYVCEISMPPRKGYVVPRTGHVQATLLNPLGMVVRMFVVSYDFRDMPSMSQTFVRQRILSFDENANPGQSVDDLSPSEQNRLLRYAIHLRFQTTRSGRLALHSDIRMLISRRTDCDTAAAHAKGALESPSELKTVTIVPDNPKFSPR